MKFKIRNKIVYCKDDSYNEKYDNGDFDNYGIIWYYRGYLVHRVNGPAMKWTDGGKTWFLNGLRHRVDGPACKWHNGDKEWYLNGIRYGEKEYLKIINFKNKIRVLDEI